MRRCRDAEISAVRQGPAAGRRSSRRAQFRRAAAAWTDDFPAIRFVMPRCRMRRLRQLALALRILQRSLRPAETAAECPEIRALRRPSACVLDRTSRRWRGPDSTRACPPRYRGTALASPTFRNRARRGGRKAGWCASSASAGADRMRAAARSLPARYARHRLRQTILALRVSECPNPRSGYASARREAYAAADSLAQARES